VNGHTDDHCDGQALIAEKAVHNLLGTFAVGYDQMTLAAIRSQSPDFNVIKHAGAIIDVPQKGHIISFVAVFNGDGIAPDFVNGHRLFLSYDHLISVFNRADNKPKGCI
jgi:hypothetical protein